MTIWAHSMLTVAHGIPGITSLIPRCLMQPVRPAQVPGDAAQPAEMLDAGPALLPWVTGLQRGVIELRGVLADNEARQLHLEVRLAGRRFDPEHDTRQLPYPCILLTRLQHQRDAGSCWNRLCKARSGCTWPFPLNMLATGGLLGLCCFTPPPSVAAVCVPC